MLNISEAIENITEFFNNTTDAHGVDISDVQSKRVGDIVYWADPGYVGYCGRDGVGIVKGWGYRSYRDELNGRMSLIVTNANPDDPYCEYIYSEHAEVRDVDEYVEYVGEYYELSDAQVQKLWYAVSNKQATYKADYQRRINERRRKRAMRQMRASESPVRMAVSA
ncbi:MAG: hypothetical protein AAF126_01945 [Chloroflexota bacterium]